MVSWKIFLGSEDEWNHHLVSNEFYSIYQSFQWGEVKKNDGWNVVRVIKSEDHLTSQAQIFYKILPLRIGFFWCPGGISGHDIKINFSDFIKSLGLRFFYFRSSFHDPQLEEKRILMSGYKECSFKINSNLSMKIDLRLSSEQLLANMSSNWRHNVKRGQKKNSRIELWANPDPQALYQAYQEFETMKGLSKQHSLQSIKGVLEKFGNNVVILRSLNEEGDLLALRGFVYLGNRALDWFAISTDKGRTCYSSYIVLWKLLELASTLGVEHYDLSGVDPVHNAGVYNFKKGAGGVLVKYPGEYETSSFLPANHVLNLLIRFKLSSI